MSTICLLSMADRKESAELGRDRGEEGAEDRASTESVESESGAKNCTMVLGEV